MASELTVYKIIFTGYSSENRFWGVFLFFLKSFFVQEDFKTQLWVIVLHPPPPHPPRQEDYLCGLGIDMLLVSPPNFCVLNCLHFMAMQLLAKNVLGWILFCIWVKNATKSPGKRILKPTLTFEELSCHINEFHVRKYRCVADFSVE